jgi:hypothetical protein
MSTGTLSQEMAKAGVSWSQQSVEQFEEGRRDYLDVQELLTIAVIFSVPPVALLVDPAASTMPLTSRLQVPTTYGLLWLVGEQPLHPMTGAWEKETLVVRLARRLHEQMWHCLNTNNAMREVERLAAEGVIDQEAVEARRTVQERQLLEALSELCHTLNEMRDLDMAVPRLVEQETLAELARFRGITLELPTEQRAARREWPTLPATRREAAQEDIGTSAHRSAAVAKEEAR